MKLPARDYAAINAFATYAIDGHAIQMYGDRPYSFHLKQVATVLDEMGADEDEIMAGLGHDLIEDPKKTHAEILQRSNQRVADMIWAVSGVGDTREEQLASVIAKIPQVPGSEKVKLADRFCNTRRSLLDKKWKKLKMYVLEYPALSAVLPSAENPFRAELDRMTEEARELLIARGDLPRAVTTTFTDRFIAALGALCKSKPPADLCAAWICDPDSEELQHWVASNARFEWASGIGTIDAAMAAAEHCIEGRPDLTEREDDCTAYWQSRNDKKTNPGPRA
jgi:hypothetical protein